MNVYQMQRSRGEHRPMVWADASRWIVVYQPNAWGFGMALFLHEEMKRWARAGDPVVLRPLKDMR